MRHLLLMTFGLLMLTFSATLMARQTSGKPARNRLPNIIYIYADDLGYGELGSYGQQKIKTPHLDRMAQEGMRFTQHYASAPVCAPSRCMLLTGRHGGHSYIRGNYELGGFEDSTEGGQMPLPQGIRTLPALLREAGYKTALVGKWGLGMAGTSGSPLLQGFDYYYGYLDQKQAHNYYPTHLWENDHWDSLRNPVIKVHRALDPQTATQKDFDAYEGRDYAPDKMTGKALGFIRDNKDRPFFLYLPYSLPHVSLQLPQAWVQPYLGAFPEQPYYGQKGYAPNRYPMSTYAGMISYLDAQVGLILNSIRQLGLDDNTLVMFSSDNGATFSGCVDTRFFNSVNGLRGLKMDLYEGGIRVPFIARWPGKIAAGKTSDLISAQYDLPATLAELCGQKMAYTDGLSFLPELLGNKGRQQQHEYLYFEYPEKGGQVAVRFGNWKGVRTQVRKNPAAPWQIFNLLDDRNETTDVAAGHPELIRAFDAIQKQAHQGAHIMEWEFINPKFDVRNINQ